jgi:hypothetical protein
MPTQPGLCAVRRVPGGGEPVVPRPGELVAALRAVRGGSVHGRRVLVLGLSIGLHLHRERVRAVLLLHGILSGRWTLHGMQPGWLLRNVLERSAVPAAIDLQPRHGCLRVRHQRAMRRGRAGLRSAERLVRGMCPRLGLHAAAAVQQHAARVSLNHQGSSTIPMRSATQASTVRVRLVATTRPPRTNTSAGRARPLYSLAIVNP